MTKNINETKSILEKLLTEERIKEFIDRINELKRDNKLDLSTDEDLSLAVMNLIGIEEHLFFTAEKTQNNGYFEILQVVREMRKRLLKKIVKEYEGEVWCTSKHLLSASMRLMEVGTKNLKDGKNDTAEEMFRFSYELYLLFWGINLKIVNPEETKLMRKEVRKALVGFGIYKKDPSREKRKGLMGKLGALVKKAVDCCIE